MMREYPYPGKYEGELQISEYVHRLSQEWTDEEAGSCSEYGIWYGLLREPLDVSSVLKPGETLAAEEEEFLAAQAGAIVEETDQGFVSVTYYETEEELDKAWAEIVEEFSCEEEE